LRTVKAEYKEGPEARENFEQQPRQEIYVSALFILGRFAHDPQSVLAAVHRLALVRLELFLNGDSVRRSERGYGAKLHVAVLANAKLGCFAHDPKFSLCHTPSLRRLGWHSIPVEIKRHHYPLPDSF
jgi:hypothetical protein